MEVDTTVRNPVTAMASCVQWITSCMSPGARSADDCAVSAPACKTQTPWTEDNMCCPASCYTQYRASRVSGMTDQAAFLETYIDGGSCIPQYKGLRAIKAGK
jgi:hypothetical protein